MRAAQSALKAVSTLVLKSYLVKCYLDIGPSPSPEAVFHRLDQTVSVLTKFIEG